MSQDNRDFSGDMCMVIGQMIRILLEEIYESHTGSYRI